MTVTYTHEVASCQGLGCFWKLLFRWKGSIYKLVWPDLVTYTVIYFGLSFVYRFALGDQGRRNFENVSLYCENFSSLIPVSFILGFYVNIVVQRWWAQYLLVPWPDPLAILVSNAVHGRDDRGRVLRRNIIRYVNLCFILAFRMNCVKVMKRFPTLDHLVDSGILMPHEKKKIDAIASKTTYSVFWIIPLNWAASLCSVARKEGRILDDMALKNIMEEICILRKTIGRLLNYDTISVPLVYTQVVTLAVYTFFLATLMGRQFLDPTKKYAQHTIDFYFPIFTYLQFFFYMGWLKVAESLLNPFGEDDDDFEINWLLDRHLQVSFLIVDEMHDGHPDVVQDTFWDIGLPRELPYTPASEMYKRLPPMGSTAHMDIPEDLYGTTPTNVQDDPENPSEMRCRKSGFYGVLQSINRGRRRSLLSSLSLSPPEVTHTLDSSVQKKPALRFFLQSGHHQEKADSDGILSPNNRSQSCCSSSSDSQPPTTVSDLPSSEYHPDALIYEDLDDSSTDTGRHHCSESSDSQETSGSDRLHIHDDENRHSAIDEVAHAQEQTSSTAEDVRSLLNFEREHNVNLLSHREQPNRITTSNSDTGQTPSSKNHMQIMSLPNSKYPMFNNQPPAKHPSEVWL